MFVIAPSCLPLKVSRLLMTAEVCDLHALHRVCHNTLLFGDKDAAHVSEATSSCTYNLLWSLVPTVTYPAEQFSVKTPCKSSVVHTCKPGCMRYLFSLAA